MIVSSPQDWVTRMRIDEDAAKALADAVRGYSADNVTVLDVRNKIDFDPDRGELLEVMLILTDPPDGERVWSREAVRQIRAEARTQAGMRGLTWENTHIRLVDVGGLRAIDPAAVEGLE